MSLHGHNLANDTPHIVGMLPSRGIIPIDGWIYFDALVDAKIKKKKKKNKQYKKRKTTKFYH